MPRPKGSKNKNTVARQKAVNVVGKKEAIRTLKQKPDADTVTAAVEGFQSKLMEAETQVMSILTDLAESFKKLNVSVTSSETSEKKTKSEAPPSKKEESDDPDFSVMTLAELQEFIDDNDLDVDLDDYKGLSKKRGAVEDAFEESLKTEDDEDEDEDDEDDEDEDEDEVSDEADEDDEDDDDWDEPKKPAVAKKKSGRR